MIENIRVKNLARVARKTFLRAQPDSCRARRLRARRRPSEKSSPLILLGKLREVPFIVNYSYIPYRQSIPSQMNLPRFGANSSQSISVLVKM